MEVGSTKPHSNETILTITEKKEDFWDEKRPNVVSDFWQDLHSKQHLTRQEKLSFRCKSQFQFLSLIKVIKCYESW